MTTSYIPPPSFAILQPPIAHQGSTSGGNGLGLTAIGGTAPEGHSHEYGYGYGPIHNPSITLTNATANRA
jgi:hypothetical protein